MKTAELSQSIFFHLRYLCRKKLIESSQLGCFYFRIYLNSQCQLYLKSSVTSQLQVAQASALLRNVQNIKICMGEKTVVSVAYECKRS